MTEIAVREANATDLEAMSRVLVASIRDLCELDHRGNPDIIAAWTGNKTPEALAEMLSNPQAVFYVAEHGGEVAAVGCTGINGAVLLNYVAPEHRFQGVSRALLAAMEQGLRERGIEDATLDSTETAHRFYLGAGWTDAAEPDRTRTVVAYPMQKRL